MVKIVTNFENGVQIEEAPNSLRTIAPYVDVSLYGLTASGAAFYEISFARKMYGDIVKKVIPTSLLLSNRELICFLVSNGYANVPLKEDEKILCDFLRERGNKTANALFVEKLGWLDDELARKNKQPYVYVTPDKQYSEVNSDLQIRYVENPNVYSQNMETAGKLKDWVDNIGIYVQHSPLLTMAVCMGLGAIAMKPCGIESFMIHIWAVTSKGKTITELVGQSLYRKAEKNTLPTWDITKIGLMDNDLIQSEIKKIRRNPEFSREMRNAADTDFSILDQVNQNLSEAIEDAKRAGHMPTVMRLTQQKNELLKQMDKIAPQYKQARNLYEAKGKALRAQAIGEDVFNPNVSPELMKRKMKDMDWLEQNTLKIGSTAELIRRLGQAQNEAVALGKMLNDNSLKKLELVYGKPSAKVFKEYAESEVKRNRNTNRVLSGSQTSEKQSLRDKTNLGLSILSNPTGAIGTLLGAGENRILQETNKAIADLLTDPRGEALIRELDKLSRQRLNQDIAEILMTTNLSAASQLNK